MAYDVHLGDRINQILTSHKAPFFQKEMMGGLVFMVNNKMCCGTHFDKKFGENLLMLKIAESAYQKEINKPVCLPMDFTGRPMKGFIFITPDGFDLDKDLNYWIQLALNFNIENYG